MRVSGSSLGLCLALFGDGIACHSGPVCTVWRTKNKVLHGLRYLLPRLPINKPNSSDRPQGQADLCTSWPKQSSD